jgi:hypothetical protein
MIGESDLPAGFHRKIAYSHPERRASRTRRDALVGSEVLVAGARAAGELDNEALAHEVGPICLLVRRMLPGNGARDSSHTEGCRRLARIQSKN